MHSKLYLELLLRQINNAVVQSLSCVWFFVTLWTSAHQASLSFTISWSLLKSCALSWWCHPTISSLVTHFSSCLQYFSASWFFPVSQLFTSGDQSIGVSDSASVLPKNIQRWFSLGWLLWSLCHPRDSQESSPTPQFKSINSSALSFLYSPTFTSIRDSWKNRSFDYTDFCQQVMCFLICCLGSS